MKPDYGFRLVQEGVTSNVDLLFYGHAIFSIDVLGRSRYTTMADKEHGGTWYAVSLDFGQEHLDRILSLAPPHVARHVRTELTRDSTSPRAIDLPEPIQVDVRARLGQPQKGSSEVFVPLICHEILTHAHMRPMLVKVSRSDVEHQCTGDLLGAIGRWVESSKNPLTLVGQLQILFVGYDSDPRELWEVPEVRQFVQALDAEFAFWFYFADLKSDSLRVLTFCLCRTTATRRGSTAVNHPDFAAFLERHFGAMNQIINQWHVNEATNKQRTEEILSYFERSHVLN